MLQVTYPARVSGKYIPIEKTQLKPSVSYRAEPDKSYALIMSDPDAPAADWLHWLIVDNKRTLVPYNPPAPPVGEHRYIFYLCEQSHPLQKVKAPPRKSFNTAQFIKSNGLKLLDTALFTTSAA
jgi:phosphatidylethanolamine-binding protein (PEBP) family uncharacterized protein